MYTFCQELKKKGNLLYLPGSVKCWIDDFKVFVEEEMESEFPLSVVNERYSFKRNFTQEEFMHNVL